MKLQSVNAEKFVMLSKSSTYQHDFYEAIAAPYFKASLLVETWGIGVYGLE